MTSPFAVLGLEGDADAKAVKQAYARLLRQTRPDEDPGGFQRLHAAYRAALQICQNRQHVEGGAAASIVQVSPPPPVAASAEPAPEDQPSPPTGSDGDGGHAPAGPPFDIAGFCSEAMAQAAAADPQSFAAWLEARPELWSLQVKDLAGRHLLHRLYREVPPMPGACLDVLLRFFDLDHALSGQDPMALLQLKRRMQLNWGLQPENRAALAKALQSVDRTAPGPRMMDHYIHQLQQPFQWWQVIQRAVSPQWTTGIARFIRAIGDPSPANLPITLNPRQVRFWLEAAESRAVNGPRLVVKSVRSAALLLLGGLLSALIWSIRHSLLYPQAIWVPLALAGAACLVSWAWTGFTVIDGWQSRPELLPVPWPWLCLGLIPLLVVAGVLANHAAHLPAAGACILVPTALLALRRNGKRRVHVGRSWGYGIRVVFWLGLVGLRPLLDVPDQLMLIVDALAAGSLVLWGMDLWHQRHGLRVWARRRGRVGTTG